MANHEPDVRLLTIDEAADRLRVSRRTIYELMGAGEIPTVRIRRRVFITEAACDQFIRAQAS